MSDERVGTRSSAGTREISLASVLRMPQRSQVTLLCLMDLFSGWQRDEKFPSTFEFSIVGKIVLKTFVSPTLSKCIRRNLYRAADPKSPFIIYSRFLFCIGDAK